LTICVNNKESAEALLRNINDSNSVDARVMTKIAGIKEIILDKKNKLTIEYNKLKAFDKSSNKRKMLMHSILVLKVILDKMESNFSA